MSPKGADDLAQAVRTAVINKRAGGAGLIVGRKAFQRPTDEGAALIHAIQDVYLDPRSPSPDRGRSRAGRACPVDDGRAPSGGGSVMEDLPRARGARPHARSSSERAPGHGDDVEQSGVRAR